MGYSNKACLLAWNQPAHLLPLPVLQVFADGIPPRPNGLFPPNDPLLRRLAADPNCHPFEKHLPGEQDCYELLLPNGGWATGDTAAARGVDLRLFYKVGRGARSAVWGSDDKTTCMQHLGVHALCYAWRRARDMLRMPVCRSRLRVRRTARSRARCSLATAPASAPATT